MDYPNKKDISFIDIYDDEVATYPRAVTYTGTVSTDSQDSKVLIADSDGDGFTTNFVEFGNNVAGFEEIRKGYYLFDGTEIRKVVGVTPSAQAITLDSPFTTSYEGLPLKVIKPILLPRVTFQNTGAVDGSIYTKTSPTDQTQYGSITLKAGDGYTFDSSTLSAFVIDSTNTTVKLSNAFFFEVGASGGGGGSFFFTKTKADIDTLIAGNDLVAGALYEITGVHPTLYDDGTTSGTTVYLRAISGSELEVQGMGKFYNPKYNQAVDGFGIWENKMYGTFSSISGNFDYQNKEAVTADNSATGILLADGMIQWVSGDWSTATSITGDVSSATATVAGFVSPSYGVGDKVIWGGYSWTNVNGNVGASTDVLNLNAEWSKNVYDTTNYNIAYDVIEYDYTNDMIIRRHEIESNVDIRCSKVQFDYLVNYYGLNYNPISVQQFGNSFNLSTRKGQLNINVNGGYNESVNFCGAYQSYLTFGQNVYQSDLTFGQGTRQSDLTFGQGANQSNLTFGQGAYQNNITFGQRSHQSDLTFGQGTRQSDLTFGQGVNQNNLTFGQSAYQNNLTFGQDANQSYLTFGQGAYQSYLTFGQGAYQSYLIFGQGANQLNLTFGQSANQNNLTFGSNANQQNLTFGSNAYQQNLTFGSNAYQQYLNFAENTQLNYNNQTLNSNIEYVSFRTKAITVPDLSTATYIYDNTLLKDIYTRPDGTLKLKYMNNSDVLVVNNITD